MTHHDSYLAGYRAAKESAAELMWQEVIDREQAGDLVSCINALPDPAPPAADEPRLQTREQMLRGLAKPAADPERAARLAEIQARHAQQPGSYEGFPASSHADIGFLLSLIPPEAP